MSVPERMSRASFPWFRRGDPPPYCARSAPSSRRDRRAPKPLPSSRTGPAASMKLIREARYSLLRECVTPSETSSGRAGAIRLASNGSARCVARRPTRPSMSAATGRSAAPSTFVSATARMTANRVRRPSTRSADGRKPRKRNAPPGAARSAGAARRSLFSGSGRRALRTAPGSCARSNSRNDAAGPSSVPPLVERRGPRSVADV